MNKLIMSIVAILAIAIGGYFVDDGYKAKIDGLFGSKQAATASSVPTARSESVKQSARSLKDLSVVNVSVQSPAAPFYNAETGRAKGFNVDFLNLVFKQAGIRPEVKFVEAANYEDVPKQLLDKRGGEFVADIAIDGLTFTDSDLRGVSYTLPYVKDFGYALIAPQGTIKSIDAAQGKVIGIIKGDPDVRATVERVFRGAKIVELDDSVGADGKWMTRYFNDGSVDAIVFDYPFAVAEIEGTNLQFVAPKLPGSEIEYKIGVRAEDGVIIDELNTAIRNVVESDDYRMLLRKHLMSTKVVAAAAATGSERVHVVVRGDTLGTIAAATLGDSKKFVVIQQRNNLANPNFISVGQKLVIPN